MSQNITRSLVVSTKNSHC